MRGVLLMGLALGLASGCLTVSQSAYPVVKVSSAPAGTPTVALSGFEATVTRFMPVYGYATVWNGSPGYYHRGHYHPGFGHSETVSTTTYVPRTEMTTVYVQKAQDAFEQAGFFLSPTNAAYVVDVTFLGPTVTDDDRMAEFASIVLTAGLSDRTAAAWYARLKVTETKSGRVVFRQDYRQDYTAWSIGLVPLFSALSAETVQDDYIQNWCLSALTDQSTADATAFLSGITNAP